jgi:hypothetical protein
MSKSLLVGLVSVCLWWPAAPYAQSLETPRHASHVSGIGYVRGWKCTGGNLTYTIDDGPHVPLSYGGQRGDTFGVCGDTNNGFITQQNWNLLGNGQHIIRVFDNGVQFGQATFTVTTLGSEYLTGQSGSTSLSFAGKQVTLSWSESEQNFVITAASGGSGGGLTDLSSLIGDWIFSYTIISTFTDAYSLTTLSSSNGVPILLGTDQ